MCDDSLTIDHIVVTGEGLVETVPDQAVIAITVDVTDPTLARAHSEANRRMAQLLEALRAHGVSEQSVRTSWYDVRTQRDWRRAHRPVIGYEVSHRIRLTVEPIVRASEVIDTATAAKATSVDLLYFEVSDRTALERKARAQAMADARDKAAHLAELAGRRLGKAVRISTTDTGVRRRYHWDDYPVYGAPAARHHPTEVHPGTVTFSMSVTVTFALED